MPKKIIVPDRGFLENLYITEHFTSDEIAHMLGVSKRAVLRWLHLYEIDMRLAGRGMVAQGKQQPTRDDLMKLIHKDKLSYQEIADMYGATTRQAVFYWMKKFDVPHRTDEETKVIRWYREREQPNLPTREEFLRLYEQGWSVAIIARDLGLDEDTVLRFCHKQGIELRLNGWRGQRYECQDGHSVRSVFEQRVDDWLYKHDIEHIYEPPLPFDRRYLSDFFANGYYIEIWGVKKSNKYYHENSTKYNQRKLRKLAQYKEHNLPLIEIHEYDFDSRPERKSMWERRLQLLLK